MQDGLGLVFEQQGNTGAAAYNQPVLGIGTNPLDRVAADIEQQKNIVQQNNLIQQRQNEKLNQQALDVGGSGWEIDNDRQLGQYLNAYKTEVTNLLSKGIKPTDYEKPESRRYWELKQGWENLRDNSLAQKEQFGTAYKAILQDMNSPNPQFEHEQTFQKMREWQNLPIEERIKTPIESLLVKKEAPFDMYSPIKDVDISKFVGEVDFETPEFASGSSKLNTTNLKESIKKLAYNPLNDAHYEQGKKKGLWDTRDEYAQVQYDKKKLEFTQDTNFTKKEPKGGYTINYINGGNANQLMGDIGFGKQSINVPDGSGKTVPIAYKYTTQLGNIDAIVGKQSIIDANTGNVIGGTGNMALKSGSLVLTPVYKGTNKPYPLTPTMDQKKLVSDGTIEWKPMVSGKAESTDGVTTDVVDVWIPADAILHGTGDSNKALNRGEAAYYVYKKKSDELNKTAPQKTASYTIKGKKYTLKDLEAMGYTAEQVANYLDK